jgi:ABC-type lipoprotein export system ATPase subunit
MEFINQLADKRGYKIILISHDNRLTPQAERLYKVNKGEIKLVRGGEDDN